ncbi:hypothetical protein [Pareuzebyella sediminis]|uniref:hypothetical protein n=1 Tax=Pareuzebyella sediminis TaxID=2607998 RepID=UPI0011EC135A|nr:hypothetical protein [Pareuzebyella sediminis]
MKIIRYSESNHVAITQVFDQYRDRIAEIDILQKVGTRIVREHQFSLPIIGVCHFAKNLE